MSASAVPAVARRAPRPAPAWLVPGAFALLALFSGWTWSRLVAPAAAGRMTLAALVAIALLGALTRVAGLPRAPRSAARLAVGAAGLALLLLVSGAPARLLAPGRWVDLLSGLGQGLRSLPRIPVPYRGVDPWIAVVLIASGGLLLASAAACAAPALRSRRPPVAGALLLTLVYAVGAVERHPGRPFMAGAVLALLGGALLWGHRVAAGQSAPALVFALVAVLLGVVAAPRLAGDRPWVDYEGIIEGLSSPAAISFEWNHGYGPLHWPRTRAVMFRVAARRPAYFKTVDLDRFDGRGWRGAGGLGRGLDDELAARRPAWREQLRVTIGDLRSSAYVGAGSTLSVARSPRYVVPATSGTFVTGRDPLRSGDSYVTDVYVPHPTALQLAGAGTAYPRHVSRNDLSMELPPPAAGPRSRLALGIPDNVGAVRLEFPPFGAGNADPVAIGPDAGGRVPAGDLLRRSAYAGVYALALRLREQATTPIEYVRAIEAHLAGDRFAYTERPPAPPAWRPPLVSFLLDTREGYCQHFSGAMALLLRMGGVPARVASGFTSGTYDAGRREWVVRDVDAHSWVEAYFPKLGWVTFDPTPGIAPPRAQLAQVVSPQSAGQRPLRPDPRRADVPHRPPGPAAAVSSRAPLPVWPVVLIALVLGFGGAAVLVAVRARRRQGDGAPELAELQRALRRTGRPPGPEITLYALERRFARDAPEAAAYVGAVRLARFGGRPQGPTAEQRRALRAELAAGLGWTGRLRAWWALPPARRRSMPV